MKRKWGIAGLGIAIVVAGILAFLSGGNQSTKEEGPLSLAEAAARGLVSHRVFGADSLTELQLELTNKTPGTIVISIPAGTVFEPVGAPKVQRMGVIRTVTTTLAPRKTIRIAVPVACLDMELDQPSRGISFKAGASLNELLARLASSPTFQNTTWRIRQFVIWTVFSRPKTIDEYAGLGFGQEILNRIPAGVRTLLTLLRENPTYVYQLSTEEISTLIKALGAAGIPCQDVQDLHRLFLTGGPTAGELQVVKKIFVEAGIPLQQFPFLK